MRYVMGTSGDREPSAQLTDGALAAEVTRKARCADGTVDPDEWFPVSTEAEAARREAARAIAICTACPVRAACLELSLRHWTIGQHGVWGGLVAADRAALRRRWLASQHEYGCALSILDRIWDGPPATSHAGRGDRPATAAGTSRHVLSSMRAVRMARALLRHLTAAAPGRDQARPGGRSMPPRSRRWARRWPGRRRRWTPRMPRSEPYSPPERAELAAAAQRDPAKRSSALAMVLLGIGAGLRPGELVALPGDNIFRHGRQVIVQVSGPAPVATRGTSAGSWPRRADATTGPQRRPGQDRDRGGPRPDRLLPARHHHHPPCPVRQAPLRLHG